MSSLTEAFLANAPAERQVKYEGVVHNVWFKRLTSVQKEAVLRGQKYTTSGDGKGAFEVDLPINQQAKRQRVQWTACNQDGSLLFDDKNIKNIPDGAVEALYKESVRAFKEEDEDDPGKS